MAVILILGIFTFNTVVLQDFHFERKLIMFSSNLNSILDGTKIKLDKVSAWSMKWILKFLRTMYRIVCILGAKYSAS